jgi:diaminohydroxyphosphoribosylaminopyrimidine deaminase/5-amino-6-(5-phosphoribosylamino)uracil reductase
VVVGTGTVLADEPHLTVRDPDGTPLPPDRQPTRVVVGRSPLPAHARVLDDAAPTLHLTTADPAEALACLAGQGVSHVWLEGGPRLAGAFVGAGLVQRVVAYYAPALLGDGPAALGPADVPTLAQAPRLTVVDVRRLGPDVRVVAEVDPDDEED